MKVSRLEYNSLMWFIIRGCFIGVSLNNILFISRQDSAIAIVLAILIGLIPLSFYFYIRSYEPNLDITEKINLLFGKFGNILNILCAVLAFAFAAIILSDLTHFISSQFLYYTPGIVISTVFIVFTIYALSKGIHTITKTSLIVFYICVIIDILIFSALITNIDLSHFLPFLYNGMTPVFKSILVVLAYNILPIFFLLIFPKTCIYKDSYKLNIIFYLISGFSIFSVCFMTISIFGINLALLYEYSGFHLLRQVNIGEFVDRIEIFLSIEWIISMCIMLIICLYFFTTTIKKTFNLSNKFNILFFIEGILLIIIQSIVADNFLASTAKEHDFILYIILGVFIFIYLVVLIKILLKKRLANKI